MEGPPHLPERKVGSVERVVVVGAGLAGLESARALRAQGYPGRVTMVGAERHPPYDRPPLSKELLTGEIDDSTLEADWVDLDVELLLSRRATKLRPGAVDTDAGSLDFDGLILATGATPVRLPGDGPQRVLRTVEDARGLRSALRPGARIAIVGAGWIGAEVTTAAAAAGCRVTVVEAGPTPLAGSLGDVVGRHTERWYAESGIDLRLDTPVEGVVEEGLALASGEHLPADEVVTAVGVRPETAWLHGSGVEVDGGIVVDAGLRSSLPDVRAAGDCAAWWSPRFAARLWVEHWDNALRAPQVAATTLLGGDAVHDPVPYFWSAQHGRMLQYAGHHGVADEMIRRGRPEDEQWAVCWLREGVLVAILVVDRPRDLMQARRIIAASRPIDRARLADPGIPIKACALPG